jgi:hypothetical protein
VSAKKMQEKGKIYNIQDKVSTPPLKPSHMDGKHQPPHKSANREESMGLVKILANCLSMSMYYISMSPFST